MMDTVGSFIFELIACIGVNGICFIAGVAWRMKCEEQSAKANMLETKKNI